MMDLMEKMLVIAMIILAGAAVFMTINMKYSRTREIEGKIRSLEFDVKSSEKKEIKMALVAENRLYFVKVSLYGESNRAVELKEGNSIWVSVSKPLYINQDYWKVENWKIIEGDS